MVVVLSISDQLCMPIVEFVHADRRIRVSQCERVTTLTRVTDVLAVGIASRRQSSWGLGSRKGPRQHLNRVASWHDTWEQEQIDGGHSADRKPDPMQDEQHIQREENHGRDLHRGLGHNIPDSASLVQTRWH